MLHEIMNVTKLRILWNSSGWSYNYIFCVIPDFNYLGREK